jgi:ribose transport system substrate-binding protein
MKNWYLLLLSLMAALILFMALSFLYNSSGTELLAPEAPIEIVLKSTIGPTMDFWNVVDQGIQEAAKEFGLEVEISGPRFEREIMRQVHILDSIIAKNPPLIILAATDYSLLVEPVEKAAAAGIPVITIDSGVDSDLPVSFIATDNVIAGHKAGREMKRLLQLSEGKDIAIVTHIKETATAIDRELGVRSALEGEIVLGSWSCEVDRGKAYDITKNLLKNKDLGGIVALNEVATLGVASAIEDAGAQDRVALVGFDNAIEELSYLEAGVIKATVVQRPYNMGYLSVKAASEYLNGQKLVSFQDTGSVLITKENMFEREYQELLFPFSEEE